MTEYKIQMCYTSYDFYEIDFDEDGNHIPSVEPVDHYDDDPKYVIFKKDEDSRGWVDYAEYDTYETAKKEMEYLIKKEDK